MVQRLTEIQTRAEEEKQEHEKQVRELERHMEEEGAKIIELEAKIYGLTLEVAKKHNYGDEIEVKTVDIFYSYAVDLTGFFGFGSAQN